MCPDKLLLPLSSTSPSVHLSLSSLSRMFLDVRSSRIQYIRKKDALTVCVEGVFTPGTFEWFVFTTQKIPFTSNNQTRCLESEALSLVTRNRGALKVYVEERQHTARTYRKWAWNTKFYGCSVRTALTSRTRRQKRLAKLWQSIKNNVSSTSFEYVC